MVCIADHLGAGSDAPDHAAGEKHPSLNHIILNMFVFLLLWRDKDTHYLLYNVLSTQVFFTQTEICMQIDAFPSPTRNFIDHTAFANCTMFRTQQAIAAV
jgi:hypothetical protein